MLHVSRSPPVGVHGASTLAFSFLAAVLAAGAFAALAWSVGRSMREPCAAGPMAVPANDHRADGRAAVAGLWTRWPHARQDGDAVRFWFFHEDGVGLYRYGKIGLNTTNSFDWRVEGDELVLAFRKTGQQTRTRYEVKDDGGGQRVLVLASDPKEPAPVAYTFVPPPAFQALAPDLVELLDDGLLDDGPTGSLGLEAPAAAPQRQVAGRLWMDRRSFATGGEGFLLYQLKQAAIDGRGVGWHHSGDFDDWSTEALTFRFTPATAGRPPLLELWFTLRQEHASTTVHVTRSAAAREEPGARITLLSDPRDFWQVHSYIDAGPSFGSLARAAWRTTPRPCADPSPR